ncbi:MAG TPA: DUF2339 domain-containing protein [Vineibacter sp.]|nr:DUF2339 domain-containing protein [Vineibacter sp.]
MDGWVLLGLLLGLALLAVPVLAIAGFVRAGTAMRRLDALEYHVRTLQAQLAGQPAPGAAFAPPPATDAAAATPAPTPMDGAVVPPAVGLPPPPPTWAPPPAPTPAIGAPPFPPSLGPASFPPPPAPPFAPPPFTPPPFAPAPAAASGWTRESLEQKLGGNLFIWLGGAALALAALFLVRYAIDQGYLSPTVRVILAAVFGAALIGFADWLRPRDARVAQALAAAGVASLFGALLASAALYVLIPKFFAGVLAMALTAIAIGLALRHGPFVAALGFVGGVLSPIFLGTQTPNIPLLFGYLLAISVGTLAVIRHRGWWWLGWGVLFGDVMWSLAWLGMRAWEWRKHEGELIWVGLFQVAVAGLFVWATWRRVQEEGDAPKHVVAKVWAAVLTTGLLLVFGIAEAEVQWAGWLCLALHAAGVYALARYVPRYQWLAVAPVALSLLAFLIWRGDRWFDPSFGQAEPFWHTIAVIGFLLAAGAYALMWNAGRPGFWAALSAAAAFLHLLVAYGALRTRLPDASWGLISLALAVPYLAAAERLVRWRTTMAGGTEALGFAATGVVLFVAAAIPLELERQWITMAYALALPAVAWIAWKLDLRILRYLCWAMVGIVTVRLVTNPWVLDYRLGGWPILNWILYTYGLSALAFWLANWFLKLAAEDALTVVVDAAATLFLFLLVTLEIRSLFHPDGMTRERLDFVERATYVAAWGVFALLALLRDSQSPSPIGLWAWRLSGGLALVGAVVFQALLLNPMFVGGDVGAWPIVNGLLLGYLFPALLAAGAAWWLARSSDSVSRAITGASAVFLLFVFVTAEVRHLFHPTFDGNPFDADGAELYLYSLVWLAFGVALLAVGFWQRLPAARHAGMAVVCLTVCKVFLVDMSGLGELLRVLSFLGLGAVLLALAFVYRRFVFTEEPRAPAAGA